MESLEILRTAAKALNEKKAVNILGIKVEELTVLTEYFLMATATSSTHVRALADEVEAKLEEKGLTPHHIEGRATGWLVLDYQSVIVNVFSREQRDFYGLDKMWGDGEIVSEETLGIKGETE